MILSDLHVHTTYCDGKSTIDETVKKAISMNMVSVGFSSHGYTGFDTSYCMSIENSKKYENDVRNAAEKYRDKIEIYLGVEQDLFWQEGNVISRSEINYDYIIGSAHYIKKDGVFLPVDESAKVMENTVHECFEDDYLKYAKYYFETVSKVAASTNADIIGHFDLVSKFNYGNKYFDENSAEYKNAASDALGCIFEKCKIIEMNTGAVSRGYRPIPYPSAFILKRIKELGMKIILSSDSHQSQNLCFGFDDCTEVLKQNGFKSVVVLKKGKFTEVGI